MTSTFYVEMVFLHRSFSTFPATIIDMFISLLVNSSSANVSVRCYALHCVLCRVLFCILSCRVASRSRLVQSCRGVVLSCRVAVSSCVVSCLVVSRCCLLLRLVVSRRGVVLCCVFSCRVAVSSCVASCVSSCVASHFVSRHVSSRLLPFRVSCRVLCRVMSRMVWCSVVSRRRASRRVALHCTLNSFDISKYKLNSITYMYF